MEDEFLQIIARFQAQFPYVPIESMFEVAQHARVRVLEVGDFLVKPNQTFANVAYVVKGLIRSYYINENGDEVVYNFEEEGRITGNWCGTLLQLPSEVYLDAIEPSIVAEVDIKVLDDAADKDLNIARAYRLVLKEMLAKLLIQVTGYTNEKPEVRYQRFFKDFAPISHRISQKHLAAYIGVTPVSLSRIKSRLQQPSINKKR